MLFGSYHLARLLRPWLAAISRWCPAFKSKSVIRQQNVRRGCGSRSSQKRALGTAAAHTKAEDSLHIPRNHALVITDTANCCFQIRNPSRCTFVSSMTSGIHIDKSGICQKNVIIIKRQFLVFFLLIAYSEAEKTTAEKMKRKWKPTETGREQK